MKVQKLGFVNENDEKLYEEKEENKKSTRQKVKSKGTIESKHWVTLISIWDSNDDAKTFVLSFYPKA